MAVTIEEKMFNNRVEKKHYNVCMLQPPLSLSSSVNNKMQSGTKQSPEVKMNEQGNHSFPVPSTCARISLPAVIKQQYSFTHKVVPKSFLCGTLFKQQASMTSDGMKSTGANRSDLRTSFLQIHQSLSYKYCVNLFSFGFKVFDVIQAQVRGNPT